MTEREPDPESAQVLRRLESELDPVDTLPNRLGFEQSEAFDVLQRELVTVIIEGDESRLPQAWREYQAAAEIRIEALPEENDARARAQVGLIVSKGILWGETGNLVRKYLELLDAQEYANGWQMPEAAELDEAIQAAEGRPELEEARRLFDEERGY